MSDKAYILGTEEFDTAVLDVMKRYKAHYAPYVANNKKDRVLVELHSRVNLKEVRTLDGEYNKNTFEWTWKLWYAEPWYVHKLNVYGAAAEQLLNLPGRRMARLPSQLGTRLSTMWHCVVCGSWVDEVLEESGWIGRCQSVVTHDWASRNIYYR